MDTQGLIGRLWIQPTIVGVWCGRWVLCIDGRAMLDAHKCFTQYALYHTLSKPRLLPIDKYKRCHSVRRQGLAFHLHATEHSLYLFSTFLSFFDDSVQGFAKIYTKEIGMLTILVVISYTSQQAVSRSQCQYIYCTTWEDQYEAKGSKQCLEAFDIWTCLQKDLYMTILGILCDAISCLQLVSKNVKAHTFPYTGI